MASRPDLLPRVGLVGAFFASGAAALVFQVLWFRQLAFTLGNTVWAGSLVLASFMGGLALGNIWGGRWKGTARDALRRYAGLECLVAATGLGLVFLLPLLPHLVAPALGAYVGRPMALNAARLGLSCALMLIPTTAMGMTMPVLMAGLANRRGAFAGALGRLYGWNTLGATVGALASETWLIAQLGLTGTGVFAAVLDLAAAALAVSLARRWPEELPAGAARVPAAAPVVDRRLGAIAAAAALVGGCGLALEVIWFRFLTSYAISTSLTFALMLAVVLCGIGLGGLAGGRLSLFPDAQRWMAFVCAAMGVVTIIAYITFHDSSARLGIHFTSSAAEILVLAMLLMAPTCLLSGLVFPLMGGALRDRIDAGPAAATLTLSNTGGAMVGALMAGFALLPGLGMERSFFLVSAVYGIAALVLAWAVGLPRRNGSLWAGLGGGIFLTILALFPFGVTERVHLPQLARRHGRGDLKVAAWREGLTETSMLLRGETLGVPSQHYLVTNGHPMSSTAFGAQRYMRLYAYWAMAVHADLRKVALISYGVGNTAAALTEWPEIEAIDVVDISRDIVEMSRNIFPAGRCPVDDPRVLLHVEDGRFFLLTTPRRYDLITSEPPPPRLAGVVNLYTQDYFALLHSRLNEGGLVTYWLPVHDLDRASAGSVVRGFCAVFADCSLWTGNNLDWMLVGSRGRRRPATLAEFMRPWSREPTRAGLRDIGLDTPERLGALFQGDAHQLRPFFGEGPALSDDFPHRLRRRPLDSADFRAYGSWMEAASCKARFAESELIRALWPPELRARSAAFFEEQARYRHEAIVLGGTRDGGARNGIDFSRVADALRGTETYALPLLLLGSSPHEAAIARDAAKAGRKDSAVGYLLGMEALAERRYAPASAHFDDVARQEPGFLDLVFFRALSHCLSGDSAAARPLLRAAAERAGPSARAFWEGARCP